MKSGRPKKWCGKELEKLRKLTENHTFSEIAVMYDLNRSAIQMACNRNGIRGQQRNKGLRRIAYSKSDRPKRDPFERTSTTA